MATAATLFVITVLSVNSPADTVINKDPKTRHDNTVQEFVVMVQKLPSAKA
ncbi:hypothetical protein ACMDCR_24480 [Labrys okinawensis]|uniref:hypothetical protein n=1 Tax=Labrys okinawensis TaxID=346911 RepID=UPI0039BC9759